MLAGFREAQERQDKVYQVITWFETDPSQQGHRDETMTRWLFFFSIIIILLLFILKCIRETGGIYTKVTQTTFVLEKIKKKNKKEKKCKRGRTKRESCELKNSASSYHVQKSKRINKVFFSHLISCTPDAFVKRSEILLFIEFLI